MKSHRVETVYNTDVATTTDKQIVEGNANAAPAPEATSTVRPWTADFLLPSIRFREPNAAKISKRTD